MHDKIADAGLNSKTVLLRDLNKQVPVQHLEIALFIPKMAVISHGFDCQNQIQRRIILYCDPDSSVCSSKSHI